MSAVVPDPDIYWKASQAVLAGAIAGLAANGVDLSDYQTYVSTRGLMLEETDCGCEQLVVVPGIIEDAAEAALNPETCGWRHRFTFTIHFGTCVTEFGGNKGVPCSTVIGDPGDPCNDQGFVPPPDLNTVQGESYLVARARWILWHTIRGCVTDELCDCLEGRWCNSQVTRVDAQDLTIGGCEWTDLTIRFTV